MTSHPEFEKYFPLKSGSFKELTDEEIILLHKNTVETTYNKGELIIKQGTKPSNIVFIKKGLIKISFAKNNQELVLSLEKRGKLIGLQALFSENVYPYSAYCCEEVKACLIDFNIVKYIIQSNYNFAATLIGLINEGSVFLYHRMACLSLNQIQGRFAHLLLFLSLSIYKKKVFTTPLSKKDMAQITNMSQESLSRVIRDFISERIIEFECNKISILNFKKIRHLSVVS